MGQEFGQEREFSEKRELDWNLLDAVDGEMSDNERLRQYVSVLNSFYLAHPAMYELDARPAGFEWISTLDADHSVIAFYEKAKTKHFWLSAILLRFLTRHSVSVCRLPENTKKSLTVMRPNTAEPDL